MYSVMSSMFEDLPNTRRNDANAYPEMSPESETVIYAIEATFSEEQVRETLLRRLIQAHDADKSTSDPSVRTPALPTRGTYYQYSTFDPLRSVEDKDVGGERFVRVFLAPPLEVDDDPASRQEETGLRGARLFVRRDLWEILITIADFEDEPILPNLPRNNDGLRMSPVYLTLYEKNGTQVTYVVGENEIITLDPNSVTSALLPLTNEDALEVARERHRVASELREKVSQLSLVPFREIPPNPDHTEDSMQKNQNPEAA